MTGCKSDLSRDELKLVTIPSLLDTGELPDACAEEFHFGVAKHSGSVS